MIRSFRDLLVWQKAMDLVTECYAHTRSFPKSETFALASQIQRAAVSVPSNIAEGCARTGKREFLHHLSIASGSLAELETQLELAQRLGYISLSQRDELLQNCAQVGKMLHTLSKSLQNQIAEKN